ncbi:hypothetical protein F4679DRAFT_581308 [Xylaria curta]|nr:hypothetical protein F4679DRAFT_581308 [Xylaria curta]
MEWLVALDCTFFSFSCKGGNLRQTLTNAIQVNAPITGSTELLDKGYKEGILDAAGNLEYGESVHVQFDPEIWKSRVIHTTDKLKVVQESGGNVDQRAIVAQMSFGDGQTALATTWSWPQTVPFLKTKDAIDYAFDQLGTDREEPLVLDFASTDDEKQDIIHLRGDACLSDYRSKVGSKNIAKFHFFANENESSGEEYSVIELTG